MPEGYGGQAMLYKFLFKSRKNVAISSNDQTLEGSIFQRAGAATEKALVLISVLTLQKEIRTRWSKLDKFSYGSKQCM